MNKTLFLFLSGFFVISSCEKDQQIQSEYFDAQEYFAGGATTIFDATSAAFSSPATNLFGENLDKHFGGDLGFEQTYVTAPSEILSGLGPIFNNTSCVGCHVLDGRGAEPTVFRISVPGIAENFGPLAIPGYGTQMQDKAVYGELPEGNVLVTYIDQTFYFGDGTPYTLRKPSYEIIDAYLSFPADILLSVRVAPPVFGLGLLEAISENDLIYHVDEFDLNQDEISGRANYVWSAKENTLKIGRFGWKANQPDLDQQTAGAFNEDMGITNPIFNLESCDGQTQHDGLNDETEIDFTTLDEVSFYTKTLAVPAPRNLEDEEVLLGKKLFFEANCSACHIPSFTTQTVINIPEISNQKIYPYTDLLLHDMGEALSDNRPDFLASGSEWKTRPLWGIGLTMIANGHTVFLHDGRARNIEEAILWHGGEAEKSKEYYRNLSKENRDAMLAFLNAL